MLKSSYTMLLKCQKKFLKLKLDGFVHVVILIFLIRRCVKIVVFKGNLIVKLKNVKKKSNRKEVLGFPILMLAHLKTVGPIVPIKKLINVKIGKIKMMIKNI